MSKISLEGSSAVAETLRSALHARVLVAQRPVPLIREVVLNSVLVSFGEHETARRVIASMQRERMCWCGITQRLGKPAMRISVSAWATAEEDIDRSLAAILRLARDVQAPA